ncbi:MAG: T9SS type A sorting domain-containing protein [Bacteroidetes bacterium]|nr:T9SS type A sorting domain-containing protein [Bacteroidota bacterium]
MKKIIFLFTIIFTLLSINSQSFAQDWVEKMQNPTVNFYEVQKAFNTYWKDKEIGRSKGWKQYKRWEYMMSPRVYPTGNRIEMASAWKSFNEYKAKHTLKTTSNSNWQALGPFAPPANGGDAGRLNCIAFHPTNSNIIYVGSPSGGLWKTTDGGNNWISLTDNLPLVGVSSIVVDYSNPNIIYIATGDGDGTDTYSIGILKSTDGGLSFQTTGINYLVSGKRNIYKLIINPINPQVLLAATSSGIYKTINAGASWYNSLSGKVVDICYKPGDTNVIYAATNSAFYKSPDGGENFDYKNISFVNAPSRIEIAVSQANNAYVYLLTGKSSDQSFGGLYRSADSGETFSTRSTTPNLLGWNTSGSDTGGQAWYDLSIAVSPTNAEEIYVGGVNHWKSSNGGTTWTMIAHWYGGGGKPYVHADVHSLKYNPSNVLFSCSDGGVSFTSNGGTSWTAKNITLSIAQMYRLSVSATQPTTIVNGWQDNGTNLLRNNTWTQIAGGDGTECIIDYTNPNIIYTSTPNGSIQRTDNGGSSYTSISSTMTNTETGLWVTPYIMDLNNNQTIYAGYNNVWKTIDKGNNWTKISNFTPTIEIKSLAIAKSNSNYIYAAAENIMYKTTNGGSTWINITPALLANAITYIAVSTSNPDVLWITLSGYSSGQKVLTSQNGGVNWTNYSGNLPNLPANCIAYQGQNNEGVYVGMDVGIYYRDTLLTDWVLYANNLPNVIVDELEISPSVNKIRAATFGRGLWESPLYTPVTVAENKVSSPEISIYPSPTKGIINIDLKETGNKELSIEIFSSDGQKVYTSSIKQMADLTIDFSNQNDGIYYVKIKSNEFNYNGRFVKISK